MKVLPTAAGVKATFSGKREVRLVMEKAGTLVVEINGDVIHSLHLLGLRWSRRWRAREIRG